MLCEHKGPGDHQAGDCCVNPKEPDHQAGQCYVNTQDQEITRRVIVV